jgi:hypothetical protein
MAGARLPASFLFISIVFITPIGMPAVVKSAFDIDGMSLRVFPAERNLV